jgi:hypothetical protein
MTKAIPCLAVLALAGCPTSNPKVLWLAPDQMETRVKLVDSEPGTF